MRIFEIVARENDKCNDRSSFNLPKLQIELTYSYKYENKTNLNNWRKDVKFMNDVFSISDQPKQVFKIENETET